MTAVEPPKTQTTNSEVRCLECGSKQVLSHYEVCRGCEDRECSWVWCTACQATSDLDAHVTNWIDHAPRDTRAS